MKTLLRLLILFMILLAFGVAQAQSAAAEPQPCFLGTPQHTIAGRAGPSASALRFGSLRANQLFVVDQAWLMPDGHIWLKLYSKFLFVFDVWVAAKDIHLSGDCSAMKSFKAVSSAPPVATADAGNITLKPGIKWNITFADQISASCEGTTTIGIPTNTVFKRQNWPNISIVVEGDTLYIGSVAYKRFQTDRYRTSGPNAKGDIVTYIFIVQSPTAMRGESHYNLTKDGKACSATLLITLTPDAK